MNLLSVVLLCEIFCLTYAGWFTELMSKRSYDLANELSVQLEERNVKNATILERHALKINLADYGISVEKSLNKNAIDIGLFSSDKSEGRNKKMGEISLPMFIGFKFATIVTLTLSIMTGLVIKALGVAKLALITSTVMLISKILQHDDHHQHHSPPAYVEIEPHNPEHASVSDFPSTGGGYHPSGTANYYSYSNYVPSAIGAENLINYATVDAGNTSVVGNHQQVASKRRDISRRKYKVPIFTLHRYSVES